MLQWIFASLFFAIGIVNTFWGNDPFFGIFILALSLMYVPPVQMVVAKKWGKPIPLWSKIGVGIFIVWAALGVGELFDKIQLMFKSFGGS